MPAPSAIATPASDEPAGSHDRLARALASLNGALQEQRAAMAHWRESLDQLKRSTQGLGRSMKRYSGSLDKLHEDVGGLNRQAKALENWADSALAGRE
ncbi:MAG: hypothetical protein AB7F35_04995 [Acetobacteraceae bacterium]